MGRIPSPLAQFIMWLHERRAHEGRIPELTAESLTLLEGLYDRPVAEHTPHQDLYNVGQELHDGRPHSDEARRIQRHAMLELGSIDLALSNVDEAGYTAINIRALLANHFWTCKGSPLESDGYSAYIDLSSAINLASERTRVVAWLLIAGLGPQEIGKLLATNGSRKINRAMAELAKILGGRYYGKTD